MLVGVVFGVKLGFDVPNLRYLLRLGNDVGYKLEFGSPKKKIPQIVKDFDADLLVMAAHGHQWFKDILFGTTVDSVRHKIDIQMLVVK